MTGVVSSTKRYKYAFYETGREMVFDLLEDPYEMHDLSRERPELCAELRANLLDLLRETREPFFDVVIEHGVPCARSHNVAAVDYDVVGAVED